MGFPSYPPTAKEIEERRRQDELYDEKIRLAKEKANILRKQLKITSSVEKYLPEATQDWLRKHLNSQELLEDLEEAEVDVQWAVYDKSRSKRPLYPRKRAISPWNKSFNCRKQTYQSDQTQSLLFKLLPLELRVEVYRAVFGQLIVEIQGCHGASNGPPPSKDHRILWSSKITNSYGEEFVRGSAYLSKGAVKFTPQLLPLLQSCRQIYAEAIPILYSEFVFKTHNTSNSVAWSKYLLRPRLDMIRTAHFQLALGYPWEAHCHRIAITALASMKALKTLCILCLSGGMVDGRNTGFIERDLWMEKKHIFLDLFRDLLFIKDVDIFLPINRGFFTRDDVQKLGHIRLHGLDEEDITKHKAMYCACKRFPEKMKIYRGE